MSPPQVVVVGNGAVGQTAALLLGRWGVRTLLLDRRPGRAPAGSRAFCQPRHVLDVWAAVGAGERIAAEGVTWTTARTFHRDRELPARHLPDTTRAPFPPFVDLSQDRVEELLDERVAAEALVEVRWGRDVAGIDQDARGATVRCADGSAVRTGYVLVCDGAVPGVRVEERSVDGGLLVCDVRTAAPLRERRTWFDPAANPGRHVAVHPCPGSTLRVDWQVPPGYDLDADERCGGLDARLRPLLGGHPYELLWRAVHPLRSGVAARLQVGRVLLAGDAAHPGVPFAGRGLDAGVPDAENAAWKLAFVLRGWAPPTLLGSYHDERHAAARENLAGTGATLDRLAHAPLDEDPAVAPSRYTGSPLTTRDRPAGPGTGALLPDAPVRHPRATRLRELSRDGVLLLVTDPVSPMVLENLTVAAPVHARRLADLDPDGETAALLPAAPAQVWVVRPDAHVAAVLTDPRPGEVDAAVRRALGARAARPDAVGSPT